LFRHHAITRIARECVASRSFQMSSVNDTSTDSTDFATRLHTIGKVGIFDSFATDRNPMSLVSFHAVSIQGEFIENTKERCDG
jgi:response regulator RpfG family c-di-GMP phosphodiesterase